LEYHWRAVCTPSSFKFLRNAFESALFGGQGTSEYLYDLFNLSSGTDYIPEPQSRLKLKKVYFRS
jgi:hypothetical protein